MEELFEKIAKANKEIKPFLMVRSEKQKDGTYKKTKVEYAEVKERVIAFRKVYPSGSIITEITQTENYIMAKAIINGYGTSNIHEVQFGTLATGYARELANKPFALENAETSAIGRALGFCGFGISTSIATKEDMEKVDSPSGVFDEEIPTDNVKKNKLIDLFKTKLDVKAQADAMNFMKVKNINDASVEKLESVLKANKVII